jgi:hypothetical protein
MTMSRMQEDPMRNEMDPGAEPEQTSAELDIEDMAESGGSALARSWSQGVPSKPLLKVLPLARIIPQDVHSVMDYIDGATVAAGALMTSCPEARTASWVIGGSGIVASALTDYRISLAKVIPIEAHEVIDYGFGLSAIAAPFVFGYYKTAPVVAAMHIVTGVGTILTSLFTDYRAYKGVGRSRRAASMT